MRSDLNADLKEEDGVMDPSPPKAKSQASRSTRISREIELSKQLMEQKKEFEEKLMNKEKLSPRHVPDFNRPVNK